jgi:hypothetical protein
MTERAPGAGGTVSSGPAGGTAADVARQTTVAVGVVVATVVAVIGSGALGGTPVSEAADGALAADATLVAPAGPAFAIWTLIYAFLLALAAYQLLPSRRADPRQRRTGWLVAASALLNAAWIVCVQAEWLAGTVPVIFALLTVLVVAFARLPGSPPPSRADAVLVDGTIGLYLGWVAVATVADVAAVLVASGVDATGARADVWAVTALAAVGVVGAGLARAGRGRIAPAAALVWGLVWIAVARVDGEPESVPAAVAAILAAAVTVAATALGRRREPPGAGG